MGVVERFIETIKEIATRMAWEVPDDIEPQEIFTWACAANNDLMRHNGYSPLLLLMGRTPAGHGLQDEDNPSTLSAEVKEDQFQKLVLNKRTAYKACVEHYLSEKTKRALLAKTRPFKIWEPGEKAHYWRSAKGNSQKTKQGMSGRIHGPATVLTQEREVKNGVAGRRGVVWLVDGDRLVRAAAAHLRTVTKAEQTLESISAGSSDQFQKLDQMNGMTFPKVKMDRMEINTGNHLVTTEITSSLRQATNMDRITKKKIYEEDQQKFPKNQEEDLTDLPTDLKPKFPGGLGQLEKNPERMLAALVKQNKVEVKLKDLTPEEKKQLPFAKENEIKSFLKYRVCEAASRAGAHPGALMKMRWVITKKETGDLKARLVVLGYTGPLLIYEQFLDNYMWLSTQGIPLISAELSLLLAYTNTATINTLMQANKLVRSESSALGMKDKRSALEALALKRGMAATATSLRWCHSGAQLSDCMTKNAEKARASYNLWQQRGTWKLTYDSNFISEKHRKQKGLDTLETGFAVDADDAWQLFPEYMEIEDTDLDIVSDFRHPGALGSASPLWGRALARSQDEDDKSMQIAQLDEDDKEMLDIRNTATLIDGNRAHAVEEWLGTDRFSLVFYVLDHWEATSDELKQQLEEAGCVWPTAASFSAAQSLLPMPKGYTEASAAAPRRVDAIKSHHKKDSNNNDAVGDHKKVGVKKSVLKHTSKSPFSIITTRAAERWTSQTKLIWLEGKDGVSPQSVDRHAKYSTAATVGEALSLGARPADLLHDFEVRLVKPHPKGPLRTVPLRLVHTRDRRTPSTST
ncbi:unnamed protein product [Prorocentrum cordatum]|uniref:Uncharacterized protein n=1 Tax=Prorocentrum cordatum TaxID=2364126 RepID=A0ABN9WGQ1_9DINO|nr:unnamed protein product [Polarella glacialis]